MNYLKIYTWEVLHKERRYDSNTAKVPFFSPQATMRVMFVIQASTTKVPVSLLVT